MDIAKAVSDAVASAALAIIRSSVGVVAHLARRNDLCQPKYGPQRAMETGSQVTMERPSAQPIAVTVRAAHRSPA